MISEREWSQSPRLMLRSWGQLKVGRETCSGCTDYIRREISLIKTTPISIFFSFLKEKRKKKRLSGIFGAILEYQIYCYTEILYGGGFELVLQTCP